MYLIQKFNKFVCVQYTLYNTCRLKIIVAYLFLERLNFVGQAGLGFWPAPGNSGPDVNLNQHTLCTVVETNLAWKDERMENYKTIRIVGRGKSGSKMVSWVPNFVCPRGCDLRNVQF